MILEPGVVAPDFDLVNQFGQPVRLADYRGVKPVTLVFFPLAFSRVCQGELCELRDNIAIFGDASVELLGISVDSKHTLRAWAESESYSFQLLADFWPHGEVATAYGAFDDIAGTAHRATFVIGADGVIVSSFATPRGEARPLARYRDALAML
ncbi:peroxiredoxin [Agromyces sp. SYSU K20354]|uniref:peroxiredoxin n=1 Tax=Agromyces cavernae TaxID=2898659 RepID=UPI001E426180|nr:peroxiredoxin [Agromyces cavernae]MCD2442080.1 peroxiredoxin [Agromyces cavernae]